MFRSIFSWRNNKSIPATYTCLNVLQSNLRRIGLDKDDIVIIGVDTKGSWRKKVEPCLIDDTEVLTEKGWMLLKYIVENKLKIKIATLNPKTNKVEYHCPEEYHKVYYKGKLYCFGGDKCRIDIVGTPQHRHLIRKSKVGKYNLIKLKDSSTRTEVEHNREFIYHHRSLKKCTIPKLRTKSITYRKDVKFTYVVDYPKRKIDANDWLEFLGWYLSEGCIAGRRYRSSVKSAVVCISQSVDKNPIKCMEIERLLAKFGKVTKQKRKNGIINYSISGRQLAEYLGKTFGKAKDKFIPRKLLNSLSKTQCELLLKTLIKGDGSVYNNKQEMSFSYTTASKQLADDVQELAFKAGYVAVITNSTINRPWYGLSITKNYTPRNAKHEYRGNCWKGEGFVYDITIPNGIFFIRRNGKACWTGNCYKGNREEFRQSFEDIDWGKMYKEFDKLLDSLNEATPWNIIAISHLESDDVLAYATKYFSDKECIIVSQDADYEQLCARPNVKIFSPLIKYKGGKGAYKEVKNPYKVLSKKIEKEASDNLISPILSEEDYDVREMVVSLLTLPEWVENKIKLELENLKEDNEYNIGLIPFASLRPRFEQLFDKSKVVGYEECINKRKRKKKKEKK